MWFPLLYNRLSGRFLEFYIIISSINKGLNMSLNKKCPKCGSEKVQLSNVRSKHGILWLILFGLFYISWIILKWCIGFTMLIFIDWWRAIIAKSNNRGYIYLSKGWFSGTKKIYYCHDCSNNFKA